jgi:hypothetical protein
LSSQSWKCYQRLKPEESWHKCVFYFVNREFYLELKRCALFKNTKLRLTC